MSSCETEPSVEALFGERNHKETIRSDCGRTFSRFLLLSSSALDAEINSTILTLLIIQASFVLINSKLSPFQLRIILIKSKNFFGT